MSNDIPEYFQMQWDAFIWLAPLTISMVLFMAGYLAYEVYKERKDRKK